MGTAGTCRAAGHVMLRFEQVVKPWAQGGCLQRCSGTDTMGAEVKGTGSNIQACDCLAAVS